MNTLKVVEEKGLEDVQVFQLCECDAVASYSLDGAKAYYKELTGLSDEELYSDDEVEIVSFDKKVRKREDDDELITVREIVEAYWDGNPFIAVTKGC
ncbi:hypothetical protein ACERJO_20470 [Halalkalibacter sp. AB-rgal2]|uniref:hypothetical protein n=1 Tax=Halalkalibacter sp. AB-rgal2 TaxID=3242695 RepID=UPI00359EF631